MNAVNSPRIVITYCTQCRWLLRATWLASELLTTFTTDIAEVALRPGVGGVFRVSVEDDLVWDRSVEGGFPDLGRLKRDIRDRVSPGRDLGHTDRGTNVIRTDRPDPIAEDDRAADAVADQAALDQNF